MDSDEELVKESLAGSDPAFEGLVLRYEGKIFGFLNRFTGNAGDAEDLTQQTFVRAWRNLRRFDSRYQFSTWLYTIARNLAIGHYRRAGRIVPGEPPEQVDPRTPDAELAARESVQDIWSWARDELSPNQFMAIWLHVQEELPISEISRAMGKTQTHARVLIHRARRNLVRSRARQRTETATAASDAGCARPKWASAPAGRKSG